MSATDTTERWSIDKYQAHLRREQKETGHGGSAHQITETLRANGYKVMCVAQRGGKGSGTTCGYPDLSFRRDWWPRGLWCLLEAKRPVGGVLSEAQRDIYEDGGSYVATTPEEALAAARECDAQMRKLSGGGVGK